MADTKVSNLTNLAAPTRDDLLYIVNDPGGAPASYKTTVQDTIAGPSLLVAASDAPADAIKNADYVCSGADDQVQVQAAIDALPAGGGRVCLSSGTFLIQNLTETEVGLPLSGVVIHENHGDVELSGTLGTILKQDAAQQAGSSMVLIRSITNPRLARTKIAGFEVDGNILNQPNIWLYAGPLTISNRSTVRTTGSILIEDCYFHSWKDNGAAIYIGSYMRDIFISRNLFYTEWCPCVWTHDRRVNISNNIFRGLYNDASSYGVVLMTGDIGMGNSEYTVITSNQFQGGFRAAVRLWGAQNCIVANNVIERIVNGGKAIWVNEYDDGAQLVHALGNLIANNVIYDCANGIWIEPDIGNLGIRHNRIVNNQIIEGPHVALDYGIYEVGANNLDNIIESNTIVGAATPIDATGSGVIVRNNYGYITENHGAAGAVADGGTIAHGCAATPTSAQVTGSVANEFASVTGIGAANLTVAIKKHDGTPGTNQTIYWRAWV